MRHHDWRGVTTAAVIQTWWTFRRFNKHESAEVAMPVDWAAFEESLRV
jgi:hypothetical protein